MNNHNYIKGNYNIVIADSDGNVNIIDAASKTVKAKIKTPATQAIALKIAISGNMAYFADRNGITVAVDLASEKLVWVAKITDNLKVNVFSNIALGSDNLYVYTGNRIFAFNVSNGKEAFAAIEATSAPLLHDNKIYFGKKGGDFIEADAKTGAVLKTLKTVNGDIVTQPVLAEGRIIAGTSTGKILILNPAGF
jgi:outer membrane protein assembly factor BamB